MKGLKINVLVVLVALFWGCGETTEEKSSTKKFSDLADEEGFAEMHDEPLELILKGVGSLEKIPVLEGDEANVYTVRTEGSVNYVLVFHEWWGLNNHIVAEADRLHQALVEVDATVIAVDLYDGKVTANRDRAGDLMKGADEKRINNIVASVLNEIPDDANIATIGWCFGGGWSLKAALAAKERTKGCVMYYGMPVENVEELKKLNSDVLFVWPTEDQWINDKVVDSFKSNMKLAGKSLEVLSFEADHAFANPSSEKYKSVAAKKANALTVEYLRNSLIVEGSD